jgi:hypothetical protein
MLGAIAIYELDAPAVSAVHPPLPVSTSRPAKSEGEESDNYGLLNLRK